MTLEYSTNGMVLGWKVKGQGKGYGWGQQQYGVDSNSMHAL